MDILISKRIATVNLGVLLVGSGHVQVTPTVIVLADSYGCKLHIGRSDLEHLALD